jgi:hypothetical protein
MTPTSAAPPSGGPVDLSPSSVRTCPGCHVLGVHRDLRPGISVALLVGKKSPFGERAVVAAYRSATGAVLGQATVPHGDYFDIADVPHPPQPALPCDNLAHCFVVGLVGAHSGTAAALAITRAGAVEMLADLLASHPTFTTPDLDGDGIREIVAIQSDCLPACANGTKFWQVHRWAPSAAAYVLTGCAPYHNESRPPAHLNPAACPS